MNQLILPLLSGLVLAAGFSRAEKGQRPNILLIVGDDMGFADVGFNGCRDIPTPNLDALAASGVQFSNGYVSGPYCSPTRAGLLTGRYQQRFGHEFNPGQGTGLPLGETTLADRLHAAGYATALVGKWHLGAQKEMQPQQRGFDEFFGFLGGQHSYFDTEGILRGSEPITELDYTTDAFAREAIVFIEAHKAAPWFLYLAFNAVHTPMDTTRDRLAQFSAVEDPHRRTYNAMLLSLDQAIGKVMGKLAESGLDRNTLVLFLSDNGGPIMKGTTINGSRNAPYRGGKRTTLEGGIHVPMLLSFPGRVQSGVYSDPVIQLDLTATALSVAGIAPNPSYQLDGVDLIPYLAGKQKGAPHKNLFWRMGEQMAIRQGDFKLVRYDNNAETNTGQKNQGVTTPRLYNLRVDPGEKSDLSAQLPEKVRELQGAWDEWNALNIAPLWSLSPGDSDGWERAGLGGKLAAARAE